MKRKDDYQTFLDIQFQNVRDLNDLSEQFDEPQRKAMHALADLFGLSMGEVAALHKPGMNGAALAEAMQKARKK